MSAPRMSEAQFVAWILELAQRGGYLTHHVPFPARVVPGGRVVPEKRGKGFPDLVLARSHDRRGRFEPRLIIAEVKTPVGSLSEEQRAWLRVLDEVSDQTVIRGADERFLRVCHWRFGDRDRIEELLLA